MYNHSLKVHGQYLAEEQSLPQNASADGNGAVLDLRGTMGAMEIAVEVALAVSVADTKNLTIKLQHKDDGGSYADLGTVFSVTAAGAAFTAAAGTVLGRLVLPTNAKKNLKAVLTTTDAAASGKVSVYPHYLAR